MFSFETSKIEEIKREFYVLNILIIGQVSRLRKVGEDIQYKIQYIEIQYKKILKKFMVVFENKTSIDVSVL